MRPSLRSTRVKIRIARQGFQRRHRATGEGHHAGLTMRIGLCRHFDLQARISMCEWDSPFFYSMSNDAGEEGNFMSYRLTGQCAARFFADGLDPSVPIQRQFFRRQGRQRQFTELGCGQDTDDGTWPLSALFFRQYLPCIAIQQVGDARGLCTASIPPDAPIHFRFDGSRPGFGIAFCPEGLCLAGIPFFSNDGLPANRDAVLVFP